MPLLVCQATRIAVTLKSQIASDCNRNSKNHCDSENTLWGQLFGLGIHQFCVVSIVLHKRHIGLETTQNMLRLQGCDSESLRFLWPNTIFVIVTLRFCCDFCGKSLRLQSCDYQSLAELWLQLRGWLRSGTPPNGFDLCCLILWEARMGGMGDHGCLSSIMVESRASASTGICVYDITPQVTSCVASHFAHRRSADRNGMVGYPEKEEDMRNKMRKEARGCGEREMKSKKILYLYLSLNIYLYICIYIHICIFR